MSQRPGLTYLFVHGWGYDASVWKTVVDHLPSCETVFVDFGYFEKKSIPDVTDQPVIAVGHSLGVLWLLQQTHIQKRALISIAGFDRFASLLRPGTVPAMIRSLSHAPERTLDRFWQTCEAPPSPVPASLNVDALQTGLNMLNEEDCSKEKQSLNCPILALAASDDKIVPAQMTKTIWSDDQLIWSDQGGHGLPLTKPKWCAQKIAEFIANVA